MIINFRCKGRHSLGMIAYHVATIQYVTKRLIEWCEEQMPEWAEISYDKVDEVYHPFENLLDPWEWMD